jgi:hypothetical protein
MKAIKISISYMTAGQCVNSSFEITAKDPQTIFDNAVSDANVFARTHNGQVSITRMVSSLSICYLNCKCDVIERAYLIR